MSNCTVIPVPALSDNYMYLIIDSASKQAAVVDPVDIDAITKAAADNQATITTILTTHNHWDHSGGNLKLLESTPTINRVYGGKGDGVPGCNQEVGDGDLFMIGTNTQVKVLFTPCHTEGHVCYYVDTAHVFTGDTMFVSGCGNFNNGSPQQMTDAFDKLLGLPDDTNVWVGHEYTAKNCEFACFCEPNNEELKNRLAWARERGSLHSGGKGTVPSTIGIEKACNPFARIDQLSVMEFCGQCDDRAERMKRVRKGKDDWGRGLR
jgi:hydroxyacylglutathione hydrolase